MTRIDWTSVRRKHVGDGNRAVLPPRLKLPILPIALMKFSRECENPESCPQTLGKIIEGDSGLTTELLRYVNSASTGLRQRASSAQHAISILGIRESKLFLLSAGVKRSLRDLKPKLINMDNFSIANIERGLFAREVARLLKSDSDLAFTGGMLADFLLPSLTDQMISTYCHFSSEQANKPIDLPVWEKKTLGWTHAEAAAQVMLDWGFPDDLICCIYFHHRGLELLHDKQLRNSAVAAVSIAGLIPDALHQIPNGLSSLIQLDELWPSFSLLDVAERVDQQFREMSPGITNHFSLLRRCRKLLVSAN